MTEDPGSAASLLQDIMPILARLQTRSPHSPIAGLPGMAPSETVAAVALVADLGADSLRRLTAYLDEEAGGHEGLEHCVPLVSSAAQALGARDYALAFTLIFECYRTIAMLRLADPRLPLPGSIKPSPRIRRERKAANRARATNASFRPARRINEAGAGNLSTASNACAKVALPLLGFPLHCFERCTNGSESCLTGWDITQEKPRVRRRPAHTRRPQRWRGERRGRALLQPSLRGSGAVSSATCIPNIRAAS